ncbi:hypothetical protein [Alkaliphilus serpentinus]|uniref:Uncharacterized protein n=1 Tax=Alkaliphilus serpentinus TaxID=1482731 RepID=A0A833HLC7_9FIRM|nr:hypothetical protein [Alkaliphilus serpentinus]KAB3525657.1 hypothetical protein F8153_14890 [Alkaliphilus serpentinus]
MLNEDTLSERLKNIEVNEIDVTSRVMNKIRSKKRTPRKIILIAAMIVMSVSMVFAGAWIVINQDGSYTIKTEQKTWFTQFDINDDVDKEIYELYTNVYKDLIEISNTEGKDLIGYYMDEGLEAPFVFTSNRLKRYSISKMEEFYSNYDHPWVEIVKNSVPSDYSLSGASVNTTYPKEYFNSWIEHAEMLAEEGLLYYEEIDSAEILALLRLDFAKASQGTVRHFTASINMVSINNSVQSRNSDSQIVSIEGYDGVFTNLSGNYKLLEVVY